MKKSHVAFLVCWAIAMLGFGAMSVGYVSLGKIIAYGFGIAAMILGLYSFAVLIKKAL